MAGPNLNLRLLIDAYGKLAVSEAGGVGASTATRRGGAGAPGIVVVRVGG